MSDPGPFTAYDPVAKANAEVERINKEYSDARNGLRDALEALEWIRRHIESTEEPNIDKIHDVARHKAIANVTEDQ